MTFVRKFYISDTHFLHTNIIAMQPRPFSSIDEHDEHLIRAWNSVVGLDDIVYHLGDFAFSLLEKADRIRWIFSRLSGRKYLMYGNHDLRHGELHPTIANLPWAARPEGFLFVEDEGQKIVLSHYAQRSWQWEHKGGFHFYGHAHGRLQGIGRSRDVGVDLPDVSYTPRTFVELTRGMK
ncbi:hypothetical protein [Rhizobium skierniewicense]|uniref:hypothetical protein n=1 Tax=Rhizobium skierniewicense TaxID=984260 RepID=UPI001572D07A|nr:hypothetical protein [Rhizobium skierniewicense]NTF31798.1 hypothetical protein [Rhizobium skierniewicense]